MLQSMERLCIILFELIVYMKLLRRRSLLLASEIFAINCPYKNATSCACRGIQYEYTSKN